MAISYDQRKKSYEGMDDTQKQQYNEAIKNKGDDYIGNQYMKQWKQESQAYDTSKAVDNKQQAYTGGNNQQPLGQVVTQTPEDIQSSINQAQADMSKNQTYGNVNPNLTKEYQDGNGWRSMNYDDRKKEYESLDDAGKKEYSKFLDSQKDDYWGRGFLDTYKQEQVANANPDLNTEKFGATNGKVSVKEGTAAQTGMPDYGLDSDARMNEIVNNLNAYWANNPEFFADRSTFNQMFHYSERDDKQKALLDTYWKKKQDIDKANTFTTGDSIYNGMNDADITPDQMNYIKEYSPEAYREWQQKQLDDINLRIANLATPADPTDTAELFNSLVNKLGLDPGDPYQIYDNWYSMCERLGVFSDSEKLKSYQNQLDANHSKMESIMGRYAASTGGTVSDALAAARMSKALAPYQQMEVDLQNSYTTLLNGRNSNLAVANQSANVLAMQAQEDQRIWNQRYQALGFAMSTASWRSPEQQAQLQLQTAQIQNDMNLLNQAKLNDLNLYNQYATAKLQNKLQQELTDLSVEDEAQLKANLNNILSDYYENYGDIIKRSQPQAVEDIIAYAKKNGISVAQALTENFITPLQNKAEYKQKVATDYGMLSKQSIATINGRSVIMTQNPNGTISYKYIDDPYDTGIVSTYKIGDTEYVLLANGQRMTAAEYNKMYGGTVKGAAKSYNVVDSRAFTADPVDTGYTGKTLYDFINDPNHAKGKTGGQCGKFVNDYLVSIGVTDAKNRYYDDNLSTKLNSVNTDVPTVGSIAVFDYNHLSSDGINHGHVGIVTKVDGKGGFRVLDSNYDVNNPGKITERYIPAGTSSCKGFFDPSQPPSNTGTSSASVGTATDRLTLTALRNGQIVNSKVPETIDQLVKAGFSEDDINEALNQNMEYYLPDDQRAEKNAILNAFRQNDIVQNFQASTEQFLGLSAAVEQANGAGDLASIYMFMRSQDPRSVVREGEFEMAAQTMGLGGQVQTWFTKLANGERLTPEQRQNFIDVTVKVLQAKKQAYKLVYDEAIQQMKAASIPSVYYPTDWASEIDKIISRLTASGSTTGPDNQLDEIYASAMNDGGKSGYGYTSYGGYSEDFIQSMISSKL